MPYDISALATGIATIIASVGGAFGAYTIVLEKLKEQYKKTYEKDRIANDKLINDRFDKLKAEYESDNSFLLERIKLLENESQKMDKERSNLLISRTEIIKDNEKVRLELEKIRTHYLSEIEGKDMLIQQKNDIIAKLEGRIEVLEATVKELQNQLNIYKERK